MNPNQTPMFTQAVRKTLAYFDVFAYPLTAPELYQSLWEYRVDVSYSHWLLDLQEIARADCIEHKHGYYFLPQREATIPERERSVRSVAKKLAIARRAANKIRYLPFVRALFVCNTVATGSASADSDIDVLIVAKAGRIWLARLLVTGLLGLFRLRRTKIKITNRICLSFYLTDNALNLQSIAIPTPDIYLCYWIRQLVPTYDPDNLLQAIQSANAWVDEFVAPTAAPYQLIDRYRALDSRLSSVIKKILEKFWAGRYGNLMESQAKALQQTHRKLYPPKTGDNRSVIVSDTMMKFHENDRREYFCEEWRKRLRLIGK